MISAALSAVLLSGGSGTTFREAQAITAKPNFVFILADDMRKDDLKYMPKTRSLLEDEGMYYFNYDVNDNGTIRHFGTSESAYLTDVLRRQTRSFIDTSVAQGKPFFAYVTPIAPHNPANAAPRDLHTNDGEKGPRLDSFNEADVSEKPPPG